MKKMDIIHYLVNEWLNNVETTDDYNERFYEKDEIVKKLDKYWNKKGALWMYDLYTCEGWDIDEVIKYFTTDVEKGWVGEAC